MTFEKRLLAARKRERWVEVYRSQPEIFRAFEMAEDPRGHVAKVLAAQVGVGHRGTVSGVLEIGPGTGWLTRRMAALVESYTVVEPQVGMLQAGRALGHFENAELVCGRGEQLPVSTGSCSAVFASFVLLDLRPRQRLCVLNEALRALDGSPDAAVWVIENCGTGEYQELRGIADESGLGESQPLVDTLGFELMEIVETEFLFESEEETARVFSAIFGDEVQAKLEVAPRRHMGLDLAILRRKP